MLAQDLRYAFRMMVANPGFTLVAVLSLALGIGANTAIFSLLNNVMMSTLPVRDPHELVILTNPNAAGAGIGSQTGERSLLTYDEFRQIQAEAKSFASVMASQSSVERVLARIAGGQPEEVITRMVSGSYFSTLGVPAAVGRTFTQDDDRAEGGAPYAVISHEFWQRRFGGNADAVGKTIALAGGTFSVIGVAPPAFFGETVGDQLRRLRLVRAMRLLRESDAPLSRVALDAGFADQSHMTRTLRGMLGVTPGQMRRTLRSFKTASLG